MSLDNNVRKFFNDVKYQIKVSGEYLTNVGKAMIQHEYEDMGIKFIDENYSKKQKDNKN